MIAGRLEDDARQRLLWVLPAALLLSAAALGAFMRLLTVLPDRPPPPQAIDAQVIELPAPAPPAPPQLAPPPEPPPPPKLEPPPEPPKPAPKPEPPPRPRLVTPPPVARPAPPPAQPVAPPTPPPAAPVAPAPPATAPAGGQMSARAIYRPVPAIPEALRRRNIDLVAKALFHVAADGSAQVELVQATPEPILNRALLDTLKTWRWFPALENGKPIASTVPVDIPISVK